VLDLATAGDRSAVRELRLTGGVARSAAWAQTKADIVGVPVVRPLAEETGLLGAAMLAWTALGRHADLEAAESAMGIVDRVFEPDPVRAGELDDLYGVFREMQAALLSASHVLGRAR
jgi:xylulokinase